MDFERGLLTAVIEGHEIAAVHEARITEAFFHDDEHLMVWRFVTEHWNQHSKVPSEEAVKANYPNWKLSGTDEPLSYWIAQLQDRRRYEIVENTLLRASDALADGDTVLNDVQLVLGHGPDGRARHAGEVAPTHLHTHAPTARSYLYTRSPAILVLGVGSGCVE